MLWHLDVGLSHTKICIRIPFGSAHPWLRYVSWVKNDVNQFGRYLLSFSDDETPPLCSVRKDQLGIALPEFYNYLLSLFLDK